MSKRTAPISLGTLADRTGFHVRLAQIKIFRNFEAIMAELDLTPPVFSVLEILGNNPGITQAKLAEVIMLDRSSVVPLLDKLEARGVIARELSTTDRRVKHLVLTNAGRKLLVKASERVAKHEAGIARLYTSAERKFLFELLERINQGLE